MRHILFTLALILFLPFIHLAQTVHPDYYDGRLYFKIKADIENAEWESLEEVRDNEVLQLLLEAGVEELKRPFDKLDPAVFWRTYEVTIADPYELDKVIRSLEQINTVEYAERIPIMRKDYTPNDPLQSSQYAMPLIKAYDAFDLHQGGNAVVAVVDDAVDIGHPDLVGNLWVNTGEIPGNFIDDDGNGYIDDVNGYDPANNDGNPSPDNPSQQDHGTHVAGTAAATTDNGIGVASIGFNVKLMALKGDNINTSAPLDAVWEGVEYAIVAGADVINCSWGGGGYSQTSQNIINAAHSNNIVVVAAAGNDGEEDLHYPSAYNHVIAVANTNASDTKNPSSNYGTWIDISAPGTDIASTIPNNQYAQYSGTSMASPMVAGLAALIKSFNPAFTPDQIEQCLKSTADDIDDLNFAYAGKLGAGRINAFQALICASPNTAPIVQVSASQQLACPGAIIDFADNSFYGPDAWNWTFEGGVPATSTEQNPSVVFPAAGTYSVTLEASNEFGTNTETFNGFITIDDNLTETIFQETFEISIDNWTIENPDGGITWELVDTTSQDGETAMFMNNYQYSDIGQRDALISPSINLDGRTSAILKMDYAYRTAIFTGGDSLVVYASKDGGQTFSWVYGAAEEGQGNFNTGTFFSGEFYPDDLDDWCFESSNNSCLEVDLSAFAGFNDVVIKIENYNNNSNNLFIDNIFLEVSCVSTSIAPTAGYTASSRIACNDGTIDFFNNSVGVVTEWNWAFPGGTPATASVPNPTVEYSQPGTYEVSLTVLNSNGSDTRTITDYIVVSEELPVADFNFNNNFDTYTFENESVDAVTYFWDFGDGNTSTEANPVHTYLAPAGDYEVVLIANNGCGSDSDSVTVTTTPVIDAFGENTSLNIYPNPNEGDFSLEITGNAGEKAEVKVYDMIGKQIYNHAYRLSSDTDVTPINLGKVTSGTYIVQVKVAGKTAHQRIVIQ